MTYLDVVDALFARQSTAGARVIEVHVSPRIELGLRRAEAEHTIHPIGGGVIGRAVGADWFVDHALTGESYRFVTAPAADPPAGAS